MERGVTLVERGVTASSLPAPPPPPQAATNTLLGHFISLACSLWLLHVVGEGQGLRFQVRARGRLGRRQGKAGAREAQTGGRQGGPPAVHWHGQCKSTFWLLRT